jgi:hypothetical protein
MFTNEPENKKDSSNIALKRKLIAERLAKDLLDKVPAHETNPFITAHGE